MTHYFENKLAGERARLLNTSVKVSSASALVMYLLLWEG